MGGWRVEGTENEGGGRGGERGEGGGWVDVWGGGGCLGGLEWWVYGCAGVWVGCVESGWLHVSLGRGGGALRGGHRS
jgi:hypothetical protein